MVKWLEFQVAGYLQASDESSQAWWLELGEGEDIGLSAQGNDYNGHIEVRNGKVGCSGSKGKVQRGR